MTIQLLQYFDQAKWKSGYIDGAGNSVDTEWLVAGKTSNNRTLVYKGQRRLEDGRELDVIHTHPEWVDRGTIKGFFPWMHLPSSAIFVAEVGFIEGGSAGNVTFQVWEHHYLEGREVWKRIVSVPKKYDGKIHRIKFDLGSHLRGENIDPNSPVQIELRVDAGETAAQDWAAWVYPRIEGIPNSAGGGEAKELTLTFGGKPLQHFYVTETNGLGQDVVTRRTDELGRVFVSPWEDSVRIYFHNNILYMLDGEKLNHAYYEEFWSISDKQTINLGYSPKQRKSLEIAIKCQNVYNTIWRPIYPFSRKSRDIFPLGKGIDAQSTRSRHPKMMLSYPDQSIAYLSWVEPAAFANTGPLIHLKNSGTATEFYGYDELILVEELSHALHFSLMSSTVRWDTQWKYANWILTNLHDPEHGDTKKTNPFVAFIEAIGIFSQNYYEFAKGQAGKSTSQIQADFIRNQQQGYLKDPARAPHLKGDDVEGAVYGAIFVDFAEKVGFDRAIGTYLTCNKINFSDYRGFVFQSNKFTSREKQDLQNIAQKWGF